MTMRKLLVIMLLFSTVQLQAQTRIGSSDALATAELFLKQNAKQAHITLSLNEVIKSEQSAENNLFVFSVKPRGFVIVSATNEILAYSLKSDLPMTDELPAHIAYWLQVYNSRTDYLINQPNEKTRPSKAQTHVDPLLTSVWGQGCYHNAKCPVEPNGPCGHVSAGCVAIAMAQIMNYHKYPAKGYGSMTYICQGYGELSADFWMTNYRWHEMADTLNDYNLVVAQLVSHCGIAVKMLYGPHLSLARNEEALFAFKKFFAYPSASIAQRQKYTNEEWIALIKSDLDEQHPIYYAGISSLGGHAFVCDGYDNNGLFHFNFGWDGVADGYYTLDDPSGFSTNQSVIHDIYPVDDINIHSDSHNIVYVSPNGTGDGSSWEQATSEFQLAIYKSCINGKTIWVKEGTYYGKPEEDYAFGVLHNCKLYGGFKGDEPYDYDLSLRDFEAHPTILDGNHTLGVIDIQIEDDGSPIIIDGFTIQNGNAAIGSGIYLRCNTQVRNCKICHNYTQMTGGAVSSHSLTIDNPKKNIVEDCEFFDNDGKNGGAICDYGNATYRRCKIHDNTARLSGGGVYCASSHRPSQFINCFINNNTASKGGGIACYQAQTSFWSCLINNNTAQTGGGCFIKGMADLYNCTIVKNEGQVDYGGVYITEATDQRKVSNCIIWGNESPDNDKQIGPAASHNYCAVQGDRTKSTFHNFKAKRENDGEAPGFYVRFINADVVAGCEGCGGDWRLQTNSFCIDRVNSINGQPGTDMDGNPRLRHSKVDLGAYESNTVAHAIEMDFCESAPYYYEGIYITSPGLYSFHYPGANYDSLVILNMTVELIHLDKEICDGQHYEFFGETLFESGVYYAYFDCESYELELVVNPLETIVLKKSICQGQTYNFYGSTLSESGIYTHITDCKKYELDLKVYPLPVISMEEEICEGETYNFYGNILTEEGHYTDTVDCAIYELDLCVKPLPIVNLEDEFCEGDSYYFHGNFFNKPGHYTVSVNCSICYHLDLSMRPQPKVYCSNDTVSGIGQPVRLTAYGADTYLWSTGETTKSITIVPMADQTYTVIGTTNDGCSNTASVSIHLINPENEIILYPNPANNQTTVYNPDLDEVEVFNTLGQSMLRMKCERKPITLNLSHFENGVYIVHARHLSNHYYKKLIVKH